MLATFIKLVYTYQSRGRQDCYRVLPHELPTGPYLIVCLIMRQCQLLIGVPTIPSVRSIFEVCVVSPTVAEAIIVLQ